MRIPRVECQDRLQKFVCVFARTVNRDRPGTGPETHSHASLSRCFTASGRETPFCSRVYYLSLFPFLFYFILFLSLPPSLLSRLEFREAVMTPRRHHRDHPFTCGSGPQQVHKPCSLLLATLHLLCRTLQAPTLRQTRIATPVIGSCFAVQQGRGNGAFDYSWQRSCSRWEMWVFKWSARLRGKPLSGGIFGLSVMS